MIVTRGLGLGGSGSVLLAGLAIAIPIIVIPPELPQPEYRPTYNSPTRPVVKQYTKAAFVTLPSVQAEALIADIEARGSAYVQVYTETSGGVVSGLSARGSAKASMIGVAANTDLGQFLAKGGHDVSDEELLSMVMALLDL